MLLFHMVSQAVCTASYTRSTPGLTVTFTNTSTSSSGSSTNLYYFWDFGDGTTSTLKNPVKTFVSAGVKNIQLSIYDSAISCSASITDTIIVTPVSANYCGASYITATSNLTVTFTNQSYVWPNVDPTNFYWNFGDGTTSTLKNPVKIYTTPGPKLVTLNIYDSLTGCASTSHYDSIYVQAPGSQCKANFSSSKTGWTYNLSNGSLSTNGSSTGLKYFWDFGDSTYSTAKSPAKSYLTPGARTITLWIKDTAQFCYALAKMSAYTSGTPPTCMASFNLTITGVTATFTNTSVNKTGNTSGLTYAWDFGDGTTSTLRNPVKTYTMAGVKIIRLNIFDSLYNCSSSFIDTINLTIGGQTCSASIHPVANGLTVLFQSGGVNALGTTTGLVYFWDFGDSTTSTLKDPIKTFATRGLKNITFTIYDTARNCVSTASHGYVFCPKSASFTHTQSGLTVSFQNTTRDADHHAIQKYFHWYLGDQTYSSRINVVKTYATAGPKYVWLMFSDTIDGCSEFVVDTINVTPLDSSTCQASFLTVPDTLAPFNFTILNTSVVRAGSTFSWNFGDGITSSSKTPTHSYANFGLYRICLAVSDSACTNTYCDSVGMDSTGMLLKTGAFGFTTIDSTKISTTTGLVENRKAMLDAITLYPNPAASQVNIQYNTPAPATVSIQLSDITGRVLQYQTQHSQSGENTEPMNITALKPALYFIRISTPAGEKVLKFNKL